MLKKKETYTKLEFTYQPDVADDENSAEYSIVFEMKGADEYIQIVIDDESTPKLPFHMLSEIVRNIEQWKRGPETAAKPTRPKAPFVTDYRQEDTEEILDEADLEGSPVAIQQQVDASMERLDTTQGELSSLVDSPVPAPTQLEIEEKEEDNPTGMTVDDIVRMGPVPETPPEFRQQLNKIGRRTPKRES